MHNNYDTVIVGSGPNGLAAAITLAQAGLSVIVYEVAETVGGGTRTAELTLPGFRHDVCSAFHPLGIASPFFRSLPLEKYGLEWIQPPLPLAHPLDGGVAAVLDRSVVRTAAGLGSDGAAYRRLMGPLVKDWPKLVGALLGPFLIPRYPLELARFGLFGLLPGKLLATLLFREPRARAMFGGLSAHSILPLEQPLSAAFGLVLGMLGHVAGWPIPKGGSQQITNAMAAYLRAIGGRIETGVCVDSLDMLPPSQAVLLDVTPRQVLQIAGDRLPAGYRKKLADFRYGPGVFKLDLALDGPLPWRARECSLAGTVHVGGTLDEVAAAERAVAHGEHPEQPFVLVGQQSRFDASRAPAGKHTVWAYCHVPHGSTVDMTERIERQIDRFAPGFRDRILARHAYTAQDLQQYNPNYIGGDINGGIQDWRQLFTRPVARWIPYSTPVEGLYLCSSSTPPGGGVHGMCGNFAARAALQTLFRERRHRRTG